MSAGWRRARPMSKGKGEVRQRELVKNALRMRPDRIIVGEVRGEEAFDMLQAMNTGHEGSMTTIHANTPRDAISRLEQMVGMAGMPMTQESIRAQIASAIDIIVQTQRLSDGGRRVISISELTGMEGNVIQMQEIYHFVRRDVRADGTIIGDFRATGVRPRFAPRRRRWAPFRQGCLQSAGAALMLTGQTLFYLVYVLAAASAILAVEAVYVSYAGRRAEAGHDQPAPEAARGRSAGRADIARPAARTRPQRDRRFRLSARSRSNRLYTQSGITGNPARVRGHVPGGGAVIWHCSCACSSAFGRLLASVAFLVVGARACRFSCLRRARNKRIAQICRAASGRSRHDRPLTARRPSEHRSRSGLSAREMPDPLGTEFGIVSDEITFGLSLEQAVRKLSERVGFEGLHLLSVSLSIQAKTGGNLTEILSNLSKVLRERQKLQAEDPGAFGGRPVVSDHHLAVPGRDVRDPAAHCAKLLRRRLGQSTDYAGVPDLRRLGAARRLHHVSHGQFRFLSGAT